MLRVIDITEIWSQIINKFPYIFVMKLKYKLLIIQELQIKSNNQEP